MSNMWGNTPVFESLSSSRKSTSVHSQLISHELHWMWNARGGGNDYTQSVNVNCKNNPIQRIIPIPVLYIRYRRMSSGEMSLLPDISALHKSASDGGRLCWALCMLSSPSSSAEHEAGTSVDAQRGRPVWALSCDSYPDYSGPKSSRQAQPSAPCWWIWMPTAVPPPCPSGCPRSGAASDCIACLGSVRAVGSVIDHVCDV